MKGPVALKQRLKKGLRWLAIGLGGLLALGLISTSIWALLYPEAAAYLVQSVRGQLQLLSRGQAVDELLDAVETPPTLKAQLRLVKEVKQFAEQELKLRPTRNYERYVDLKRDYLVMVLTASPPLKMESYTWWFPIVGTVPYKGYFDKEMGQAFEQEMQAAGYETNFRPSPAYSTLGWFNDPLLNTMTLYGDYYLINTVIHECVHATHWIPGEVTFNENMASFIGNKGAMLFYAKKYGKGSDIYQAAEQKLKDQELFADFLRKVALALKKVYDSDLFDPNKAEKKAQIIASMKQEYVKTVLPRIKSEGYAGFEKQDWNNAMLMSYLHYNKDQEKLGKIYSKLGEDIPRMMAFLQQPDIMTHFEGD